MTTLRFKKIDIEAYEPGKSSINKFEKIIKLSANESALGISPKAKKVISNRNLNLSRYPDGKSKKLRGQLAKKFKCDQNKIICGAGSDEIIQMLCQLFLNSKDEVIVPQFSFLMYRIYAKIIGAKVIFAKEKNYKISISEILKKVTKKTKIVFLANPNNPTGTYLDEFELTELRDKLKKNVLLVVDDAYADYMRDSHYKSGLDLFRSKPNVFILRTFSKIYGLASLRIGWGYGDKKIIKNLNLIKPPFNLNTLAQQTAVESLKDTNFIYRSIKHNSVYARKIKKFLEKYNIMSNKVSANFLLLDFTKCKFKAKYFNKKLITKGIILRSTEYGYKIKNMMRLTIGSKTDCLKFMRAVEGIFHKWKMF